MHEESVLLFTVGSAGHDPQLVGAVAELQASANVRVVVVSDCNDPRPLRRAGFTYEYLCPPTVSMQTDTDRRLQVQDQVIELIQTYEPRSVLTHATSAGALASTVPAILAVVASMAGGHMKPIDLVNRQPLDADEIASIAAERAWAIIDLVVPTEADVLMVCKGERSMLERPRRRVWPYPADDRGMYLGHHPADDHEAILRLSRLVARGFGYLAVPEPSAWWLEHYTGLAEHLKEHARQIVDHPRCRVYALSPRKALA